MRGDSQDLRVCSASICPPISVFFSMQEPHRSCILFLEERPWQTGLTRRMNRKEKQLMTVFDPVTYKQTTRDQWRAAAQARKVGKAPCSPIKNWGCYSIAGNTTMPRQPGRRE